jgi:hypothetical protein
LAPDRSHQVSRPSEVSDQIAIFTGKTFSPSIDSESGLGSIYLPAITFCKECMGI